MKRVGGSAAAATAAAKGSIGKPGRGLIETDRGPCQKQRDKHWEKYTKEEETTDDQTDARELLWLCFALQCFWLFGWARGHIFFLVGVTDVMMPFF